MKVVKKIISKTISQLKKNPKIQNIFLAPIQLSKYKIKGYFIDSDNNKHPIYDGLRSTIKPGWERLFIAKSAIMQNPDFNKLRLNGLQAAGILQERIEALGLNLQDSHILEIGCNSGSTSFALAEIGCKNIVGSEFSGYKVESLQTEKAEEIALVKVTEELKNLRTNLSKFYKNTSKVSFIDDDICKSKLPTESFNVICSWDVLEHIHNPLSAFEKMHSLLKPGGILVHEYNPFFSLNGGHSACTLDFPWGHTRVSAQDYARYISEIRPQEIEKSLAFYTDGLNRMTIADATSYLEKVGFSEVSIVPFVREQHARLITHDILSQTKKIYNNVSFTDLTSPKVVILAKK